MRPAAWSPLLFLSPLLLVILFQAPLAAEESVPWLEPAAARPEVLEEIVRTEGVRTSPERPGLVRYTVDLGWALLDALEHRFEGYLPGTVEKLAAAAKLAARVVFVIALALLAATLAGALLEDYRRRRERALEEDAVNPVETPAPDRPEGRSSDDWAAELRRRLAAGDAAAACHALWWWLAAILAPGIAEAALSPSWTSRELIVRAGRSDLAGPVRRLDRMLYGAARPGVEDVRRLWGDLEEAVR